ncbi:hypothetical protein XBKQ1_2740027 [Xenorhabdus bovienii str. kraussei Quebec]|uniref:Uncharacterized protein n=1 Tax=Xenorhabdus bovienii str. kraussei Quebec TaxID=1398203 RepID=A0A077PLT1_XENBV|nr:hypothetical protein XBKQ1_2740027 [Xenorhabdus bovienii str. kraussei Quebec]
MIEYHNLWPYFSDPVLKTDIACTNNPSEISQPTQHLALSPFCEHDRNTFTR